MSEKESGEGLSDIDYILAHLDDKEQNLQNLADNINKYVEETFKISGNNPNKIRQNLDILRKKIFDIYGEQGLKLSDIIILDKAEKIRKPLVKSVSEDIVGSAPKEEITHSVINVEGNPFLSGAEAIDEKGNKEKIKRINRIFNEEDIKKLEKRGYQLGGKYEEDIGDILRQSKSFKQKGPFQKTIISGAEQKLAIKASGFIESIKKLDPDTGNILTKLFKRWARWTFLNPKDVGIESTLSSRYTGTNWFAKQLRKMIPETKNKKVAAQLIILAGLVTGLTYLIKLHQTHHVIPKKKKHNNH